MSKDKTATAHITERDWTILKEYCKAADPDEIIGLAHAELKDGIIWISKPMILKQKVSGASCEMDEKELMKFIGDYKDISKVRCVWHSHVRMSSHWSTTDRETSDLCSKIGKLFTGRNSWFVSIVLNIKGDTEVVLDMYDPVRVTAKVKLVRIIPDYSAVADAIKKEVKEKVQHESTTVISDDEWESRYSGHAGYPGCGYYGNELQQRSFWPRRGAGSSKSGKRNKGKGKGETTRYSHNDIFEDLDINAER